MKSQNLIFNKFRTLCIKPKSFKTFEKNKKTDMNELIDLAIKKKFKIKIYPVSEKQWIDVGQWVEYKKIVEKLN